MAVDHEYGRGSRRAGQRRLTATGGLVLELLPGLLASDPVDLVLELQLGRRLVHQRPSPAPSVSPQRARLPQVVAFLLPDLGAVAAWTASVA